MKAKHWIFIGMGLTLALASWHFYNQFSLLKRTCFGFNGYSIKELNINKIVMEIRLKLRNRSDIAFELKGYNVDIFINNTKVSTIASGTAQTIDRDSFANLVLPIEILPKNILNKDFISGFLLNYQNAIIKISGSVSINAGGISKSNIPVLMESKLRDMMPKGGASEPCV